MIEANSRTKTSATCPEKESFIALLYGEIEDIERGALTNHLGECERCAAEMAALEGARGSLAAWTAPDLTRGFELVSRAGRPDPRAWLAAWRPALAYAAAAALVIGVSAGVANLDVRYGPEGFVVRTGWSNAGAPSTVPPSLSNQAATLPAGAPAARSGGAAADDAWRTELAAMEARLRSELGSRASMPNVSPSPVPAAVVEGRAANAGLPSEWTRQIQRLVDESEVRQQQNLALRIAEVSRDFELHRRADLVEVQQGLGQLGIDATQHKQMWDYFRRVSNQEPPR